MNEGVFPKHGLRGTRKLIVYNTLFRQQEGKCAICGYKDGDIWIFGNACRLVIDHCHETGKIRGLLCNGCNTQVGNYERLGWRSDKHWHGFPADYEAKMEAYLGVKNER